MENIPFMKFIKPLFIIIFSSLLIYPQSSLERQLKELDELRAKLDGLKSTEIKENSKDVSSKMDVWSFIESSWESQLKGEDWVTKFCSDEVYYWNSELPIPHDIKSLTRNITYKKNNTKMLFYNIKEITKTIKSDLALVFYYYNSETLNANGRIIKNQGKISDVIILDNNRWKILSRVEISHMGNK